MKSPQRHLDKGGSTKFARPIPPTPVFPEKFSIIHFTRPLAKARSSSFEPGSYASSRRIHHHSYYPRLEFAPELATGLTDLLKICHHMTFRIIGQHNVRKSQSPWGKSGGPSLCDAARAASQLIAIGQISRGRQSGAFKKRYLPQNNRRPGDGHQTMVAWNHSLTIPARLWFRTQTPVISSVLVGPPGLEPGTNGL